MNIFYIHRTMRNKIFEIPIPSKVVEFAEFVKKSKPNVRKIFLFGSYAKGTWNADSDIDLAIIFDNYEDEHDILVELMKLRRNFDLRIEPHPLNVSDFNSAHPLSTEILRYGIEIL